MINIDKLKLLIIGMLICTFVNAQETLKIGQHSVEYDKQERPAVSVLLQPDVDEVRDAWEDFLKDNYDIKLKGNGLFANKDVLQAEKVKVEALSDKRLNFYSEIIEEDNNTRINVFTTLGYDINVSKESYPEIYTAMENMVSSFLQSYIPNYYEEKVEIVSKDLKDANNLLTDLSEQKADNQKDIEDHKSEIESLRSDNEKLIKKIADNEILISNLKNELSGLRDSLKSAKQKIEVINE